MRLREARTIWARRVATKMTHKGMLIRTAPHNSLLFWAKV